MNRNEKILEMQRIAWICLCDDDMCDMDHRDLEKLVQGDLPWEGVSNEDIQEGWEICLRAEAYLVNQE